MLFSKISVIAAIAASVEATYSSSSMNPSTSVVHSTMTTVPSSGYPVHSTSLVSHMTYSSHSGHVTTTTGAPYTTITGVPYTPTSCVGTGCPAPHVTMPTGNTYPVHNTTYPTNNGTNPSGYASPSGKLLLPRRIFFLWGLTCKTGNIGPTGTFTPPPVFTGAAGKLAVSASAGMAGVAAAAFWFL